MEKNAQIRLNSTDWQDPEVHARRALEALDRMPIDQRDNLMLGMQEEVREEIENLYHSFYMR